MNRREEPIYTWMIGEGVLPQDVERCDECKHYLSCWPSNPSAVEYVLGSFEAIEEQVEGEFCDNQDFTPVFAVLSCNKFEPLSKSSKRPTEVGLKKKCDEMLKHLDEDEKEQRFLLTEFTTDEIMICSECKHFKGGWVSDLHNVGNMITTIEDVEDYLRRKYDLPEDFTLALGVLNCANFAPD